MTVGCAGAASAADASTDAAADAGGLVDEVIVTGTSASNLTTRTSTTPVTVVSGATLRESGAGDLGSALQLAVPSINFPAVTIGSAAGANLNATLRGLAPDQTLVLIDGHRQHKSAFVNVKGGSSRGSQAVDLSTIPLSAIDHVEVLRDAAAAQYGSDAIAGVINIVLRKKDDGGNVTLRGGEFEDGDGQQAYLQFWKGFTLPGNGFLTVAIDAGHAGDTNQFTSPETRAYYFPGDPRGATVDKSKFYRGQPEIRTDVRAVVNAESHLSENLSAYGFATVARKRTRINGNPLLPNANETLRALYPDGTKPNQWVNNEDNTLAAGLRYDAGKAGRWDLSLTWGDDQQSFRTTKSDNASLGLASPTDFDTGSLYNQQSELTLGYVNTLPVEFVTGPITFAAGVGARREFFRIGQGELASYVDGHVPILDGSKAGQVAPYGSSTWQAYLPTDAGSLARKVYSAYASLEGPVTEKLRLSATGRAEDYSDFGGSATGQLSARYQVVPVLALRGSVSTGVRAPTIGQMRYSYTQTTSVVNRSGLYQVRTFPVSQPVAVALGAAPLRPEKSFNLSGGAVLSLGDRLSVTVDAYQIEIRDRIALSDNFTGTAVQTLLAGAGFPQVVAANFFTNALDTRTRGVSISAAYTHPLGGGDLGLNLGAEINKTDITKNRAVNGKIVVGRQTAGYLEYGTPAQKIVLSANYARGPWRLDVSGIHYGHYKQIDPTNPALDQTFSNQDVINLSTAYQVSETVRLSVGADNLFSSSADPINQYYIDGGLPTSALNPVSSDGRYVWASISYDF